VIGGLPWTSYSYTYTATNTAPTLSFTVHSGGGEKSYLDGVSVVDNSAPSIQLLNNPSFENSTSTVTDWVIWCTTSCNGGGGDGGRISTSGCHPASGSNCYTDKCGAGYDFLGQSFSATIGDNYTISFWLFKNGGPPGVFYANIS